MQQQPEISVIVPVYNAGEYLAPCIESVLAQTFTDFELILVDDASTDGSGEVCDSYADPRIRVIHKAQNGGLSRTRNTGMEYAKGRYITFLDADDTLRPDFLETTHKIAVSDCCDIVCANFQLVSPGEKHVETDKSYTLTLFSPQEAIEDTLYQKNIANSACGKLYARKILKDFVYRPIGYEDLDSFYLLFLKADKIAYISKPMYYYTMNPKSYLHVFKPERAVVLDVTERIVEYMQEHFPELTKAAEDRALSAAFNIFNLLAENRCDEPAIAERCKATIKKYRRQSLFNPKVRLKNKIGILVTYLGGFRLLKFIACVGTHPGASVAGRKMRTHRGASLQ